MDGRTSSCYSVYPRMPFLSFNNDNGVAESTSRNLRGGAFRCAKDLLAAKDDSWKARHNYLSNVPRTYFWQMQIRSSNRTLGASPNCFGRCAVGPDSLVALFFWKRRNFRTLSSCCVLSFSCFVQLHTAAFQLPKFAQDALKDSLTS